MFTQLYFPQTQSTLTLTLTLPPTLPPHRPKTHTRYPIRTRVSLTGTIIVARDIAHAKLQERIDSGEGLPEWVPPHPHRPALHDAHS